MPVGGVGGLLLQASGGGDLQRQLATGLNPPVTPNPSPMAQGGPGTAPGGPAAGGQPGQGGGALPAPSSVYSPDPVNAQNMGALLQMAQKEAYARDFNRAMYGIGASFGTKEQQESNMRNAASMGGGGGGGDILGDIEKAQGIEQTARNQWEHGRFVAGAALMADLPMFKESGVTPQILQGIAAADPELLNGMVGHMLSRQDPTEQQKNATAMGKIWAQAQGWDPNNLTPEQKQAVSQQESGFLQNAAGGALDPVERQFRNEVNAWQANPANKGQPVPQRLQSFNDYKIYQDQRSAATKDMMVEANQFDTTSAKYDSLLKNLAWLQAHSDAVHHAVQDASWRTEGGISLATGGKLMGEDPDVLTARALLNQMSSQFMGEGIHGMGRIGYAEASKLGGAFTSLGQRGISTDQIDQELQRLRENATTGYANIMAAAGKTLPAEYGRYANPEYFKPDSPWYSRATIMPDDQGRAVQPGSAGVEGTAGGDRQVQGTADLRGSKNPDADYEKLPSGTIFIGPDGKQRRKP